MEPSFPSARSPWARLGPLAALFLALAAPAWAAPVRVDGTWQLEGRNAQGSYKGTATLIQDAQGNVEGELALIYQSWSWVRLRYVPNGKLETARLRGRVEGEALVGERRPGGMAGVLNGSERVRYRIALGERNLHGSRIGSISGSYGRARESLFEHRPAGAAGSAQHETELAALRAALEDATRDLLYTSESDRPIQVFARVGAADYVHSVEDLKRELSIPAYRTGQTSSIEATLGKQARHFPGESAADAARADRFAALIALVNQRLQDVRVYRVAGPDAFVGTNGALVGEIDIYLVGRNAAGDLIGLRTVAVET